MPFAAPPIGDLRWKGPEPEPSWTGVRNATKPGDSCVQDASSFTIGSGISEDCLYLNVFTPKPDNAPKAVLVFFYGGSWSTGSGSCPLYYGKLSRSAGLAY